MDSFDENIIQQSGIQLRVHHIGCAVRSISKSLKQYQDIMGFRLVSGPYEVISQKVKVCFLDMGSGVLLELVEGIAKGASVEKVLDRPGAGVYHICYKVDNLDEAMKILCKNGFFKVTRIEQKDNKEFRYAFMLTPDRQLFELCELKK